MTNNRFDDIDKLFREGLNPEMDQFASVEADWSKLRARLDRHDKKKRGIFWLSRLGGVAALILLFFAIRTLLPDNQNKIVLKNEVQQIGRNIKEYQNSKIALKKDLNLVSKTDQNVSSLLAQNKQSGKQSSINQLDELSSVKKSQDRDTIMERNSDLQNASGVHSTQTQKPNTSQTELEKTYDPKQPKDQESLFAADEKPNLQSVSSHESRKLALSFLAASDFNGVNNLNNAIIGNDLGVIVSYKIAKKMEF